MLGSYLKNDLPAPDVHRDDGFLCLDLISHLNMLINVFAHVKTRIPGNPEVKHANQLVELLDYYEEMANAKIETLKLIISQTDKVDKLSPSGSDPGSNPNQLFSVLLLPLFSQNPEMPSEDTLGSWPCLFNKQSVNQSKRRYSLTATSVDEEQTKSEGQDGYKKPRNSPTAK